MKALVTGILGQTGSYLADLLLEKNIEVWGIERRSSSRSTWRLEHLKDKIKMVEGDITDQGSLIGIMQDCKPDFIFALAAQSYVGLSWKQPILTAEITGLGQLKTLESMKVVCPKAKLIFAASSECFGNSNGAKSLNENSPMLPRSPYGFSKVFGYHATKNYRESYGMFCASSIAHNHESPRRGKEFVTRKITYQLSRVKLGLQDKIKLGNLDSKRDWSHAKDVARAMWMMSNNDKPEDFVVGSGKCYTVAEFLKRVLTKLELPESVVEIDKDLFRPAELDYLCADASKIREKLGWEPTIDFDSLIDEMVASDLEKARKEKEFGIVMD